MDCYKKMTLLWIGLNKGSTNNHTYLYQYWYKQFFHRSIPLVLVSTSVSHRYVTKYWYLMILDFGGTLVWIFIHVRIQWWYILMFSILLMHTPSISALIVVWILSSYRLTQKQILHTKLYSKKIGDVYMTPFAILSSKIIKFLNKLLRLGTCVVLNM